MYELHENKYNAIENQNKQIEESCYRIGIPVDEYIKLIEQNESLEEHKKRMSELERLCDVTDWD